MPINIAYEDNNIIICEKQPGVASQSDRTFETDLLSAVLTYRASKGEPPTAHIINRLDKPVGGLVLFAKDKPTAAALSAMSGEHSIEKKYYAVVQGRLAGKGEMSDYILKDSRENISRIVPEHTAGSKKAVLSYEALETGILDGTEYSLVRVRLYTGRHHQIRVQFSHRGHGLYGDVKYNPDFYGARGVNPALFSYSLSFNNPKGADRITVEIQPKGKIWEFEYFK
ncbi:MAG: RluA family pseudouridine synthase [Butyrivibrio sp.]